MIFHFLLIFMRNIGEVIIFASACNYNLTNSGENKVLANNRCSFTVMYTGQPLPKYKVSGTYMPQTCSKLAASLRLIVAASLLQTRFSYANFFSGALFWPTMCAASMQRTVVAHCSGTQCAPQVCGAQLRRTVLAHITGTQCVPQECSAQLSRTILAHNVRRTVAAHYSCVPQVYGAQLPRTALFCPHPPLPPPPWFITPTAIFFFSSLPPGGVWEKMWGW